MKYTQVENDSKIDINSTFSWIFRQELRGPGAFIAF